LSHTASCLLYGSGTCPGRGRFLFMTCPIPGSHTAAARSSETASLAPRLRSDALALGCLLGGLCCGTAPPTLTEA
jgi:hypothetical protein